MFFGLYFIVYNADYEQVEVLMPKREDKEPKSHEGLPETKNALEKINLVTIKTEPKCPIQDLVCTRVHKKLFEGLWHKKQNS